MIGEFLRLLSLLGPTRLLANARTMKRARANVRGYVTLITYWSLMRAGLIDRLAERGEAFASELVAEADLDPSMLDELCRYLARLGHLDVRGDRIAFTPAGRQFWDDVSGVFHIFGAYQPFFGHVDDFLARRMEPSSQRRHDELVAVGFRSTGAGFTFAALASIIGRQGFTGMIELGCGNLDCSLHVSRQRPSMRFLGIDHDDRFLDMARETIERERLGDRAELLKHDLFELTPDAHDFSPYDLVVAIDLFHGYFHAGRERVLDLFRALRTTFTGKTFLVSEMCLADEGRMAKIAYPMIEHELFHSMTAQRTFAPGELEGLLEEAGFTIRRAWPVRNLSARVFLLFDA